MKIHAVSFGVIMIAFCACASSQQSGLPSPPPQPEIIDESAQSISTGFLLEPATLEAFKARAESGDRNAAFRLSFHFMSAGDQVESRRWQLVAAEHGHSVAQYNLWVELRDRTDCQSKREALAWLEAAANGGENEAKKSLSAYRDAVGSSCNRTRPK